MKYEFHEGDYVETKDGAVGFITEVGITCAIPYFTWIASDGSKSCQRMYIKSAEEVAPILSNRYKRIGKYDFAKMRCPNTYAKPEQPEEIKLLKMTDNDIRHNVSIGDSLLMLKNKINELVDAVNELRKAK